MMDQGTISPWEALFQAGHFGKYPSEEAIRFFRYAVRAGIPANSRALDIGCGSGAISWFLSRNGANVVGVDGSPTALRRFPETLQEFGAPDAIAIPGDITRLTEYVSGKFDLLVDHYAMYANHENAFRRGLKEARALISDRGMFLCCLFGRNCSGIKTGTQTGPNTFAEIQEGVHAFTGTISLWTMDEALELFGAAHFRTLYKEQQLHNRDGVIVERLIFYLTVT